MRGVGLGSAESVLRSQGTLGQARHSRYRARGDFGVDVPRLAAARFRCHGHRFVGANFLGQLSGLKTGNGGVSFAT